jgi:predicted unusual protein kinase regulating ubiquinone biosynthesis (AarF/ABC1/UbiB family)
MNGERLGNLLMDADIITKRQLAQACQKQVNGDKRKLGEILVEMGYVTVEDLTEVVMEQANRAQLNAEKSKPKPKSKPKEVVEEKVVSKKPKELSEEQVLNTKFTLSVQTMIGAATGIASLVGMWYVLQAEIQEAKELPSLKSLYEGEYPSKAPGYNWPTSYEQYKNQVGTLQSDMDEVLDKLDEYEETIDDLEKEVTNLRIQLANKRDK